MMNIFLKICNWILSHVESFLSWALSWLKECIPDSIIPSVEACASLLSAVNQWVPLDHLFYLALVYCGVMFWSWIVHRIFDIIP